MAATHAPLIVSGDDPSDAENLFQRQLRANPAHTPKTAGLHPAVK